jgi:uncharacterized protein
VELFKKENQMESAMPDLSLHEKEEKLYALLRAMESVSVAFSGGLDSRFLSYTCLRLGLKVRAFHVTGPHIPARESAWAEAWAGRNRLPLTLLAIDPLQSEIIAANTPERCYHCKNTVFKTLKKEAREGTLCDGTNTSDSEGYRPGLRALQELGIVSPLALAGLSKPDIRALARKTGMDRPEQLAQPCLFTRFNYGVSPTCETLRAIDLAEGDIEDALHRHGVFQAGPGGAAPSEQAESVPFRLRFEGENKTVLHIAASGLDGEVRRDLQRLLQKNGFPATPIVPVEKISGYFDRLRQHHAPVRCNT